MTSASTGLVVWAPRLMGIAVACFLALFAMDVFSTADGFASTAVRLLIHLVPALLVLAAVAVAWRWPWVGALVFLALATSYAVMVNWRPDWVVVISGPLLLVSLLFLCSWLYTRRGTAAGGV